MREKTEVAVRSQMYERSKEMLFLSLKKQAESHAYGAAALWNIRKFKLYAEDGCKTMLDFIIKHGLDERKVYRRLKDAEEVARVLQIPEGKELTRQNVDSFIQVKIEVRKIEKREMNLLITDGLTPVTEQEAADQPPPAGFDDAELFEDFDESDPEFIELQHRFIELRKPKPVMQKLDPKAKQKQARSQSLALAIQHAKDSAFQLHGLSASTAGINRSEAAKSELLYYIRLAWWYASQPPDKQYSGWLTYQEAIEMDAESNLQDSRPDAFFALHEVWES